MSKTLAFDVYGTLIDTSGVLDNLMRIIPDQAAAFMKLWRQKQLEYSFRRGLMNRHTDFSICTRDALTYCCRSLNAPLSDSQKRDLLDEYTRLPVFPDVEKCLTSCLDSGHDIYAFSNGSSAAVKKLLEHAGINSLFDDIVSTEDVHMFKPGPDVYNHFTKTSGAVISDTWLISGNSFDVMGARACGWNAAWVQRSTDSIFDPWDEFKPTVRIQDLSELSNMLSDF